MPNNIAKIRGKHQITQQELAKRLGITKQCLCYTEKTKCSLKVAKKIAMELNENVIDLLGEDALLVKPETEEDVNRLISIVINAYNKKAHAMTRKAEGESND